MQFSGVVSILPRQIRVHEKHLEPIGVYDGSRCWGVWVQNNYSQKAHDEVLASLDSMSRYHFIISPFHPSSWPFLVRLVLKISHDKGSLAAASESLTALNVNILFARCSQTGFSHATWNVIGELLNVKKEFEKSMKPFENAPPADLSQSERQQQEFRDWSRGLSVDLAAAMFIETARVVNGFRKSNAEFKFLHKRCVESDVNFFERKKVVAKISKSVEAGDIRAMASESCKQYGDKAVTADWLFHIPYISIWGGNFPGPVEFKYDRSKNCLDVQSEPALYHPLEIPKQGYPLWFEYAQRAVATFDTNELFARLIPLPSPDWKQRLCDINVGYEIVSRSPHPSDAGIGSRGLLADCARIISKEVNLIHVSNKITDIGPTDEIGEINFLGQFERDARDRRELRNELALRIRQIEPLRNDDSVKTSGVSFRLTYVEVIPHTLEKLFISIRFEHPREAKIEELLNRAAREQGVSIEIVKTYSDRATDNIYETMKRCSGFLQVLLFRENDEPDDVEFAWLNFEYGMAIGLNLPRVRMVDVVRRNYRWWQSRVETDRDLYLRGFRTDVSDDDLLKSFSESIGDIASKIVEM